MPTRLPLFLALLAVLFAGTLTAAQHGHDDHQDAVAPCEVCTLVSAAPLGEPPEGAALPPPPCLRKVGQSAPDTQLASRCTSAHVPVRGPPSVRA